MGRLGWLALCLAMLCSVSVWAGAKDPETVEKCYTYDGIGHDYIADLPEDPEGAPLIIMLPGYGETAESFRRDTGFYKDAVRMGYIIVHVTGAPNPGDRTSAAGWNYNDYDKNNDDVGFLKEFTNFISEEYASDSTRCFAVGYSNGGFMCHRLAIEAADTFTAVVCVSGTMPENVWNRRPDRCDIGFFQITGEADNTIPKNSDGSARYAKSPAIEDVMEYYAVANDLSCKEETVAGKDSILTRYRKEEPDQNREVWHLVVKDGHHSWSAESVTGICTNQMILDFLSMNY